MAKLSSYCDGGALTKSDGQNMLQREPFSFIFLALNTIAFLEDNSYVCERVKVVESLCFDVRKSFLCPQSAATHSTARRLSIGFLPCFECFLCSEKSIFFDDLDIFHGPFSQEKWLNLFIKYPLPTFISARYMEDLRCRAVSVVIYYQADHTLLAKGVEY